MKLSLLIALFLLPMIFRGQDSALYSPGYMVELRGQVLGMDNNDTLVFSKLKLLGADVVIGEGIADLDGNYRFRFCSNKTTGDSVIIEAAELGYLIRRVSVKVETDLSLIIYLREDPTFQSSEQAKQQYLDSFRQERPFCGTEEYQRDYDANPLFRHCDGRIESFRRLVELNERIEEWERL